MIGQSAPSIEPTLSKDITSSTTIQQNHKSESNSNTDLIESHTLNTNIPSSSNLEPVYLDTMNTSNINDYTKISSDNQNIPQTKKHISFTASHFSGPHQDKLKGSFSFIGLSYQKMVGPKQWLCTGFSVSGNLNPLLYFSDEISFHTINSFLKSWQYIGQLEVDTDQGLGSFFSLSYYMMGVGARKDLSPNTDLILNVFPLSTRGSAIEIKINYLIF